MAFLGYDYYFPKKSEKVWQKKKPMGCLESFFSDRRKMYNNHGVIGSM